MLDLAMAALLILLTAFMAGLAYWAGRETDEGSDPS
jgi:hypothetical protein